VGSWQLAAQGGGLLSGQVDRYLLGALLQPQFVGFYTIAQRLEEAMYIGILKVGEILFPVFQRLAKRSPATGKPNCCSAPPGSLTCFAASALGALVPVASPLLYLWTGPEVAAEAQRVLVVLAIAGMLGCSANVFAFYLLAHGQSRSIALISLVTAVFTVATSALALPYFGWQGPRAGALCAGMTAQIVTTICCCDEVSASLAIWSRVAHFVLLPLGTGIATASRCDMRFRDRVIRPCAALVVCGGALLPGGRLYFRRRRHCLAGWSARRRLLAGFARHRQPLLTCEAT